MDLKMPKRPFRSSGGARIAHNKNTSQKKSVVMPPPDTVIIPMSQHIGAPCKPLVKRGDYVNVGQVIGDSDGYVSAPIHASVSGTVKEIKQVMLTGGQYIDAVVIESDGKMEYSPDIKPPDEIKNAEELLKAARESGLVGLGGAGFPSHVKLNVPEGKQIDTLIINAAECEPYVTSDHREAIENGENVIEGIYTISKILKIQRVIIGVENNKPDVIEHLNSLIDKFENEFTCEVQVLTLKSRYPQGAEKVLIKVCTNRKVPEGALPADVGCIVMNIASVSFLASYIRTGKPLTLKRVTIDGTAILNPQNVIVPIGTKISDIIKFCSGYKTEPGKIIMGGPMMGIALTSDELPIVKQNNAILAFAKEDSTLRDISACIRCGRCTFGCPMNLMPTSLEKAVIKKDIDRMKELSIMTCMECGCCSFNCPAGRRLVQAIRLGKDYIRKEAKSA